jgi:hypothetical protein
MERRRLDLRDFDALSADVERLKHGGYTKAGNWDLGQTCHHLARSMQVSLDGFAFKAPWYLRIFIAPIFKRKMFRTRTMRAGINGPPELMPGPQTEESSALKDVGAQLVRVRNNTGAFQEHAFFGTLTNEEWKQFHLIHAAHHLSFLIPRKRN